MRPKSEPGVSRLLLDITLYLLFETVLLARWIGSRGDLILRGARSVAIRTEGGMKRHRPHRRQRPAHPSNTAIKELRTPKYRPRVARNRKVYDRKAVIRGESDRK